MTAHPRMRQSHIDELKGLCRELIDNKRNLTSIEQYLPLLRTVFARLRQDHVALTTTGVTPSTVPPDDLADELRFFGWALYEAGQVCIDNIAAAFSYLEGETRARSETAFAEVTEIAGMARGVPWPEFCLRSLGAVRCQALAHSKRDTSEGYDDAATTHTELDKILARRSDDIESGRFSDSPHFLDLKRDLAEISEQLHLSRTGTACREPEYVLSRWIERTESGDVESDDQDEIIADLAYGLRVGVESGERAIELADLVFTSHGLAPTKDEKRLLGKTSMQNPGIMTARAYLLLLPMCPLMESYEYDPPDGDSWEAYADALVVRFVKAYQRIERPFPGEHHDEVPYVKSHLRSLVQLRLAYFVLCPTLSLPSDMDDGVLGGTYDLDDVTDLSRWLAAQTPRADANVIGSATMPEYLRGIEETRSRFGVHSGYRAWRREWLHLDRFHHESGRDERALAVLGTGRD
ncbi:MAG: hypothetical protein EKK51_27980 [Mycolicibacterium sp.]|uniref:hypothetical protein n=1 Tax=Mycolicibacterium sp. TaxID=2320850 RepID=UPI000FA398DC|nr:hypothetical protein [Mycolicibacterium sp.]RUP27151.1 MAG: hypothetical protein EKK51_27980 [Mycolicibacterium sp.]